MALYAIGSDSFIQTQTYEFSALTIIVSRATPGMSPFRCSGKSTVVCQFYKEGLQLLVV